MKLPTNVCGTDRTLRAVLGVVLAVVGIKRLESDRVRGGTALFFAGAGVLFTPLARFCPVNLLLGRNSCQESV